MYHWWWCPTFRFFFYGFSFHFKPFEQTNTQTRWDVKKKTRSNPTTCVKVMGMKMISNRAFLRLYNTLMCFPIRFFWCCCSCCMCCLSHSFPITLMLFFPPTQLTHTFCIHFGKRVSEIGPSICWLDIFRGFILLPFFFYHLRIAFSTLCLLPSRSCCFVLFDAVIPMCSSIFVI
jgi:hypothetical protein